jgi:predicted transcriptional regulator
MDCSKLTDREVKILYYCKMSKEILKVAENFEKTYNYIAGVLERLYKKGFIIKKQHQRTVSYMTPINIVTKVEEEMKKRSNNN